LLLQSILEQQQTMLQRSIMLLLLTLFLLCYPSLFPFQDFANID